MKRFLIAAAILSIPATTAFAEGDRGGYGFDEVQAYADYRPVSTSVVALDTSLRAAEANLDARVAGGLSQTAEIQLRAEINHIRGAVNQEKSANGGALSDAAQRTLSDRLQAVQQSIYRAQ